MANLHLPSSSSTSNKSITEEVARAIHQLLLTHKEQSGMRGDHTHLNKRINEASTSSPTPTKATSCNRDMDTINYRTPANKSFASANEIYAGKSTTRDR